MTPTLEQLRAEHEAEFIGCELMRLLERVASATARTYPPSYSDFAVWNDEAVADALQGWVAERLLGRRDLTKLLAGARSATSLKAGLTRSFQQYLTNGRRRDSATNLFQRTVKLLRTDSDFEALGASSKPHDQLWTLRQGSATRPSTATFKQRLEVAAQLSDDDLALVRYRSASLWSSPILRAPALKRFVTHLLSELGALTPADILEIMRRRFALPEPEQLDLTEDLDTREPEPHDAVAKAVIARSICARTSEDDARLLAALAAREDVADAAQAVGRSSADVQHALQRLLEKVALEGLDEEDADQIAGLVLTSFESLFSQHT
jgi:hypothetical protein